MKINAYLLVVLGIVLLLSFMFWNSLTVNGQNLGNLDNLSFQQITDAVKVPNITIELQLPIELQFPRIIIDLPSQILLPNRTIRHVKHDCTGVLNCYTDLQAALDDAQPGDEIVLEAGATFTGNFILHKKDGSDWITVRTSLPEALPVAGTRITLAYANVLPKIVTPNTMPAIATEAGAHHYHFLGVEITGTYDNRNFTLYNIVLLQASDKQNSLEQVPHDIVFERTYIHGTPTGNVRRGIAMNGASISVLDSYLSDFHEVGADSQAIGAWNAPGPFKIVNNYLEGAGENIIFGGGDPISQDFIPSDIEIRGNHFRKPLSWRIEDPSYANIPWTIKNLFELKNARRVLIDGNIFENNWVHAQGGAAILFTVRNQDGTAPWSTIEDVTFTNNIVRHSARGINILGHDNNFPSQQTKRILIRNNLFDDINAANFGGGCCFGLLLITDNASDVIFEKNTAFHKDNIITASGTPNLGFVFRGNIVSNNDYGVAGSGTATGINTLTAYFPDAIFSNNLIIGGNPSFYPSNNFFPDSLSLVGFVDILNGDYRLIENSPYSGAGADTDSITAATSGVASGIFENVSLPVPLTDTDGDGVADINDKCPFTKPDFALNVNIYGCPIPYATKFSSALTTNFLNVDLRNFTGFEIGVENIGQIDYGSNKLSLLNHSEPVDLNNLMFFFPHRVVVDSDSFPELNKSVTITFFNITTISNPLVLKDNSTCADCLILNFNSYNLSFKVQHFTEYTIDEGSFCGDSFCSSLENCSICSNDCGACAPEQNADSGSNGGSSGGGGGGSLTFVCNMDWKCSDWAECLNGSQKRQCNFANVPSFTSTTSCPSSLDEPLSSRKCEIVQEAKKPSSFDSTKKQSVISTPKKTTEMQKPTQTEGTRATPIKIMVMFAGILIVMVPYLAFVIYSRARKEDKKIKQNKKYRQK